MPAPNTLGSLVLSALEARGFKHQSSKSKEGWEQWRGSNPFRGGSNSGGFVVALSDDGKSGAYFDHGPGGEKGGLVALAEALGIEVPRREAVQTKREYKSLKEYAEAHGVSEEVFADAKWKFTTRAGRPAISFPTKSGTRYRMVDGNKPWYLNEQGYTPCWFGLHAAISMAQRENLNYIVLVNGEASSVVTHHFGLPGFTMTSGEREDVPPTLLGELRALWKGQIVVAYDCDEKGRKAGVNLAKSLFEEGFQSRAVDLGLTDGGDAADFCRLYTTEAASELPLLKNLYASPKPEPIFVTWDEASKVASNEYDAIFDEATREPLPIPFRGIAQYGGLAEMMTPKMMMAIAADSGIGKTTLIECLVDHWRRHGFSGIFWGPEWSSPKYVQRAVQRYGGASLGEVNAHAAWHLSAKRGVPEDKRPGKPLTPERIAESQNIRAMIDKWAGKLTFLDKMNISAQEFIKQLNRYVIDNEPPAFVVVDYAQLLVGEGRSDSEAAATAANLRLLKGWMVDTDVVGVVGSQITKGDGRAAAQGGRVGQQALQSARTDVFNLAITLSREIDSEGRMSAEATAAVVKNSGGLLGTCRLYQSPGTQRWGDFG